MPGARADRPPAGSDPGTFPAWWSDVGRPGWVPDGALAHGMPWTLAGLTTGAWELRDPFAPAAMPAPGLAEAQAPLAWYDSAAVVLGEGAAWRGFGAGLATAEGYLKAPTGSKPRAILTVVSGAAALDRNALILARGDERAWLRVGATAAKRGGVGDLDLAGQHLWTMVAGTRRGPHAFDVRFAQRGMGERQRAGVGESARGRSGALGWCWARGADALGARWTRGFDARELVPIESGVSPARREAEQNELELTAQRGAGARSAGLRLAIDEARVIRTVELAVTRPPRTEWNTRSWWLAGRASRPLGEGQLDLQLGGGRDRSPATASERTQLAPSLAWRARAGDRTVRLFLERIVDPVWSDLDPQTRPFVQDTWAGGFDAAIGVPDTNAVSFELLGGRAGGRATLLRYPVRDEALLVGWQRDARRYDFVLAQAAAHGRWRAFEGDLSGYLLGRERGSSQPQVDPNVGARAGASYGVRVFAGDLGVRLRGQAAWVGARATDARVDPAQFPFFSDRVLPGYSTLSASATFTLGDATIVLRADGLENVRHDEGWIDPSQVNDFVFARDSGRTYRLELSWPFFN